MTNQQTGHFRHERGPLQRLPLLALLSVHIIGSYVHCYGRLYIIAFEKARDKCRRNGCLGSIYNGDLSLGETEQDVAQARQEELQAGH